MNRFFRATALGGRLHLQDLPDHGPWEPSRIVYTYEREVDLILPRMVVIRKVRTVEDLMKTLKASEESPGSESLYVSANLLDEAQVRWEEMRRELTSGAETHHGHNYESC